MLEKLKGHEYQIGHVYKLKLDGHFYQVTLIAIDETQNPPLARVLIREHSVDSFINHSGSRKRHTKKSEVVPCANVPLNDLW